MSQNGGAIGTPLGWSGIALTASRSGAVGITAPDTSPPIVTNLSIAPGATIAKTTAISFCVSDNLGHLGRVLILARFTGTLVVESVYSRGAFDPMYADYSTVVSNGPVGTPLNFIVARKGGWLAGTAPSLEVYAFDAEGNESA